MYGAQAGTATTARPSGYQGEERSPRDVGTFGMAANRLRSLNSSLSSIVERLNREGARLRGEPLAHGKIPDVPQVSADHNIPGLLRELEATEQLVGRIIDAAGFIESL